MLKCGGSFISPTNNPALCYQAVPYPVAMETMTKAPLSPLDGQKPLTHTCHSTHDEHTHTHTHIHVLAPVTDVHA